jgi:hypothetical protein
MDGTRIAVHVLLVLCLIGIMLTIAADEWSGARRWKLGVTLLVIAYAAVGCLR